MVITNVECSVATTVPGTKRLKNGNKDPDNPHEFSFTISRTAATDGNGNAIDLRQGYQETKTVAVTGTNTADFSFVLNYVHADFMGVTLPVTITYEIREAAQAGNAATIDSAVYTVTVIVDRDAESQLTAENTIEINGKKVNSADFVNTLLGELVLVKQVAGSGEAKVNGSFEFTVWIGSNANSPLKNTTLTLVKNGVAAGTVTTDSDGNVKLTGVKHDDRIALQGIPLGSAWRITETNAEGYLISWTKNGEAGASAEAEGSIPAGGMEVVFTNTVGYELPETGGAGTTTYTMAGLVLMCVSMAYLMYRPKARRREEL